MATTATLTTHVLDTQRGTPACQMEVLLSKYDTATQAFREIVCERTSESGRINFGAALQIRGEDGGDDAGIEDKGRNIMNVYKIRFYTHSYFEALGQLCFYPYVDVVFQVGPSNETAGVGGSGKENHYHVPLIVSPFGYSTYRGS